jgi:hypothetical protein
MVNNIRVILVIQEELVLVDQVEVEMEEVQVVIQVLIIMLLEQETHLL